VTVVSRTTKAINHHDRTGTPHMDFRGTALMPAARAKVLCVFLVLAHDRRRIAISM
jgi:hypothetical protein